MRLQIVSCILLAHVYQFAANNSTVARDGANILGFDSESKYDTEYKLIINIKDIREEDSSRSRDTDCDKKTQRSAFIVVRESQEQKIEYEQRSVSDTYRKGYIKDIREEDSSRSRDTDFDKKTQKSAFKVVRESQEQKIEDEQMSVSDTCRKGYIKDIIEEDSSRSRDIDSDKKIQKSAFKVRRESQEQKIEDEQRSVSDTCRKGYIKDIMEEDSSRSRDTDYDKKTQRSAFIVRRESQEQKIEYEQRSVSDTYWKGYIKDIREEDSSRSRDIDSDKKTQKSAFKVRRESQEQNIEEEQRSVSDTCRKGYINDIMEEDSSRSKSSCRDTDSDTEFDKKTQKSAFKVLRESQEQKFEDERKSVIDTCRKGYDKDSTEENSSRSKSNCRDNDSDYESDKKTQTLELKIVPPVRR